MPARLRHIALASDDPPKTADFYKELFGLTELRRKPAQTGADGVWLSDGYIYLAILKFGSESVPNLGKGPTTVPGVHHIGFYVEDLDSACQKMDDHNAPECPTSTPSDRKFEGPDGLMIDLRVSGWQEQIARRMVPLRVSED